MYLRHVRVGLEVCNECDVMHVGVPVFLTPSFMMDVWKWKRSVLICCMDALLGSCVDPACHKTGTHVHTHNNVEMSLVSASCGESWSYQTEWAQQTPASMWLCVILVHNIRLPSQIIYTSTWCPPPPLKSPPGAMVLKVNYRLTLALLIITCTRFI